jgi:hypothetical protein
MWLGAIANLENEQVIENEVARTGLSFVATPKKAPTYPWRI